jgi:capsular exopolysaccharide synthesis family protein
LAIGLSAAFLVRSQIIPRYQAEAQIVLDVRNTTILKFDAVVSGLPPQPEVVQTEMDVIASRGMAERVLDHLTPAEIRQLGDDGATTTPMSRFFSKTWPDFLDRLMERLPLLKRLTGVLGSIPPPVPIEPAGAAEQPDREHLISLVLQGLKVSNDGRSYTIHIAFASPHPDIAAIVANTYADQYLANQIDMKAGATTRANELLSQRLGQLREQLQASERAVESYRRAAGVLGDKAGSILVEQLSQTNAELALARNQRIESESRLQVAQSELRKGGDVQALSDVLASPVLQALRAKQAELKRQQAQLSSQYTAQYPTTKTMQADMATLQAQISEEATRAVNSLTDQVAMARTREAGLQSDLDRLERQFGEGGEAEVKLRQLEREAEANRAVYEAYLNRLKQIADQQQMQTADAHLISSAIVPTVPTYPRYRPLLALGLVMGGVVGISVAFLLELFDRRLRSIGQVEEMTGLPVIALMPSVPWRQLARPETIVLRRRGRLSPFNEALRSTWAAVQVAGVAREDPLPEPTGSQPSLTYGWPPSAHFGARIVLVTSSVPNEGKTAFCVSLARSLAVDGHKVLLIDADLRRPGVARCLGGSSKGRMVDLVEGKIGLDEAVQIDRRSGAHYLTAGRSKLHPQDLLNALETNMVLEAARRSYEIILIDTPPILIAADAALVARNCDCCLFFIRWGTTTREQVQSALRRLALYKVKVSGTVLSHVNLRRHSQYAAGEGYHRSYGDLSTSQR